MTTSFNFVFLSPVNGRKFPGSTGPSTEQKVYVHVPFFLPSAGDDSMEAAGKERRVMRSGWAFTSARPTKSSPHDGEPRGQ